jgi:hypothetical protein
VLRADLFHGPGADLETVVTAKAVFGSRAEAEREVRRLNALRPEGRVRYWCTCSRLFRDGGGPEDGVDPA